MEDFEQLYQTHFQDVYRYLLGLSRDPDLAEEITSETFFKALRALEDFRGDCDFRVWLCQIAKNTYFSHRKKTRSQEPPECLEALADPTGSPEEQAIRSDQARRILEIVHALPPVQKEVFLWRVYGELSFRQIGQLFGKSENWACVTYHRTRATVRARMEESS